MLLTRARDCGCQRVTFRSNQRPTSAHLYCCTRIRTHHLFLMITASFCMYPTVTAMQMAFIDVRHILFCNINRDSCANLTSSCSVISALNVRLCFSFSLCVYPTVTHGRIDIGWISQTRFSLSHITPRHAHVSYRDFCLMRFVIFPVFSHMTRYCVHICFDCLSRMFFSTDGFRFECVSFAPICDTCSSFSVRALLIDFIIAINLTQSCSLTVIACN